MARQSRRRDTTPASVRTRIINLKRRSSHGSPGREASESESEAKFSTSVTELNQAPGRGIFNLPYACSSSCYAITDHHTHSHARTHARTHAHSWYADYFQRPADDTNTT
jgi:hypothetical protein